MRLVFVGCSGSGKTTLAERVALENDLGMFYTNLKNLPAPTLESPLNEVIRKQRNIRIHILNNILKTEGGCFDRSIFDEYCYSNRFLGNALPRSFCNEESLHLASTELKWSRLLLNREISVVNYYFFCQPLHYYRKSNKIEEEYVSNKKRWGDLTLEQIYTIMKHKLLPKEKLIVVPAMGLEERVELVNNFLRQEVK